MSQIVLVVSLLLIGSTVFADGTPKAPVGKISGTVIDHGTGEALIGVTLLIQGTAMGAKSDLDGHYMIKDVPAGVYRLHVSSIGYAGTILTDIVITESGGERIRRLCLGWNLRLRAEPRKVRKVDSGLA
jgi:hypothetical protein